MAYYFEQLYKRRGVTYPNPFFDVLNHYIPTTLKELFEWFEYAYFSNPIIASAIQKFATYPITEPVFDADDNDVVEKYKEELEKLEWKTILINAGTEYFVYGNSFVISFSHMSKEATCSSCGTIVTKIDAIKNFKLNKVTEQNVTASGICPKCGNPSIFSLKDLPIKEESPKITIWNPKLVTIKRHPLTGKCKYYSRIPEELQQGILSNDVFIIESTPIQIIISVKQGKEIEFRENSIFHLKRGTLSGRYQEWGTSVILPVLKNLFLIQVYRKANEAIALDHILPLRVIFPQPITANSDPATSINLNQFKKFMEETINKWRKDPNLIVTSPIPVGETHIGGSGKLLDVTPIIQQLTQEVLVGLGVPQEFVFGGLTWSGSSVSLRMLENQMFNYVSHLNRLLQWIVNKISATKDLPKVKVKLKPFKMADDVEQKGLALRAAEAGIISRRTLLEEIGFNYDEEIQRIQEEMQDLQMLPQMNTEEGEEEEEENVPEEEESPPEVYPPRTQENLLG